jgi:hypothetical protein
MSETTRRGFLAAALPLAAAPAAIADEPPDHSEGCLCPRCCGRRRGDGTHPLLAAAVLSVFRARDKSLELHYGEGCRDALMVFNSLQGVEDFACGEWDGRAGDAVHRAQDASRWLRDQLPAGLPLRMAAGQLRAEAVLALCDLRDAMQALAD